MKARRSPSRRRSGVTVADAIIEPSFERTQIPVPFSDWSIPRNLMVLNEVDTL
jgi:hypothetical protein